MAEWPIVRFEDLAADEKSSFSKPYGSAYTKSDYVPDGVPLVRGVNLGNGIFHDADYVFITAEKADQLPGANLTSGDLVITHRGTIGQVSMIPRSPRYPRYVLSTSQVKARLDSSRAVPEFYYYWLSSPAGQHEILSHISTVGVPGLVQPVASVKGFKVPHPSLGEQQAVVDVLRALDDKIAINERISTTVDGLADSIFGQRTRSAQLHPMSKIMTPTLGGTPDRKVDSYWGPGVPWASARDVASATAGVVADTDEQITEKAVSGTRVKPLPKRSVVLTARGTVGAVARVIRPMAINQSCYAFRPGDIPPAVLFHLVRTGAENMLSLAHGTVFSTVNMKTFDHVRIPMLDSDMRLALEEDLAPLHRQIEARVEESRTLRSLRDTLLPQLMSGKLRVRDAEKIVEDAV
ncbi:restriction endonuclease subunit S [Streptomyces sp. NPDC096191]|uniref:restriction endonuclease subunit S n=1 Tax=Streptomyces sp. NPDC096191 TaxID=3155426 RepID=UPI00332B3A7C